MWSTTDPLIHHASSADAEFERLLKSKQQEAEASSGWSSIVVTSFSGKYNELTHDLAALKEFCVDYSDCVSNLQDGSPARKLELVFRLAQKYGDSTGIVGELFAMFADMTEAHFGQLSNETLDSAYEDILKFMSSSWEQFPLFQIGSTQTVDGDVDWDADGKRHDLKGVRAMMSGKKAEFIEYVNEALRNMAKPHIKSALYWFIYVLLGSTDRGKFGWLSFRGMFRYPRTQAKSLRWCEIGFRIQSLIDLGGIHPSAVYCSAYTINQFDVYSGTEAPQFGKKLAELQSLLEAHLAKADYLRNKALAYFTAFLIFAGNVLATMIAKWTGGLGNTINDQLGLNFTSSQ